MSPAVSISFPWHFDQRGHTAVADGDSHIRDMIEQLLLTSPGERVNRPDFGSGVLQLLFAPSSPELAATLQFAMRAALQRWLGDLIEVQDLAVTNDDSALRIDVAYLVRRTAELRTDTFTQGGGL